MDLISNSEHMSSSYSEYGLCYVWGMINGSDPDTITYFPTVIGMPDRWSISHFNIQSREIVACDVNGMLYKWDMEFRRRLERIETNKYILKNNPNFFTRKVFCGRSMIILLDSILSPEKSWVWDKVARMETLVENEITIELFDILNLVLNIELIFMINYIINKNITRVSNSG